MSINSNKNLNFFPDESRPVKQTQSSGAGGKGIVKTIVGYSDGSDGAGGWAGGGGDAEDIHSVPHQHLKDLAVTALEQSLNKNCEDVQARLLRFLQNQPVSAADETASILSALVVTAYAIASTAQYGSALS